MDPDRLRAISVFASLDDETLQRVAMFATASEVPAGEQIVREGDLAYEFMAIEAGEAAVSAGGEQLATLGPGDYFGEIGLLEGTPRTASVTATTPMALITLSRWDLERIGDALEEIRAVLEERKRNTP